MSTSHPNPSTRRMLLLLPAVVAAAGAGMVVSFFVHPGPQPIDCRPLPNARQVLLQNDCFYLQNDPRWRDDTIGGSGESIGHVGCTLCCLSMALACHGLDLDPAELNRRLKSNDGYTSRGWLKWEAVPAVTGGKVFVTEPARPDHEQIQRALEAGNPVIVKVMLPSGIQHWVLVVGRDQNDYLVKDPLDAREKLRPLSEFNSGILAIRVVAHGSAQSPEPSTR